MQRVTPVYRLTRLSRRRHVALTFTELLCAANYYIACINKMLIDESRFLNYKNELPTHVTKSEKCVRVRSCRERRVS